LDADVSFDSTYYENILDRFKHNPRLGLAGGFIYEQVHGKFLCRKFNNVMSVPHAVQLFRRECFEAIGGYIPLPYGGPDWVAEVTARMKGWEVHAFPDLIVYHHKVGTAVRGVIKDGFRQGRMDYSVGSRLLFEIIKCLRRAKRKPYVLASLVRMSGFICELCKRKKRLVSREFVKFLRKEQTERIKSLFHIKQKPMN